MTDLKSQIIKLSRNKGCDHQSVLYACKFLNLLSKRKIYPDSLKEQNGLLIIEFFLPHGYEFIEFSVRHGCIVMREAVFPEKYARDIAEYSFLSLDTETMLLVEIMNNLKKRINGEYGLD